MLRTTAGQAAVNFGLPEALRDHGRVLDKKGIKALLRRVAEEHPEAYRDVVQHLSTVGYHTAQLTGGNSFGPEHLSLSVAGRKAQVELGAEVRRIYGDPKRSDDEKEAAVIALLKGASDDLTKNVLKETLAEHNPLGMQVLSGARGNPTNLRSLRAGDLLYVDHRDRPIPVPILRSYAQGLSPVEYYAGTFGARKGVIDTKLAVQRSGFASKQFNQAAHRLVVVGLDDDAAHDGSPRGLPVRADDPDNEGALLAVPAGPYPRNTTLTPKILADIKARGLERIVVRSPLTGGHPNGGLYGRDLGVREKGTLPPTGDFVGIASAQALSEPLTQSMLSSKHAGGVAGAAKAVGGFDLINSLFQVPKVFKGAAAHARVDGRVTGVRPAPQGGHYVAVDGKDHYVGHGYTPAVKVGDVVEAGDVLSDGVPHPGEVVAHKGLGEGRRYFVDAFRKAYKDSGIGAHRRNVEVLARGLINHVEMDGEWGEYVPGDTVPYHAVEHAWEPRDGHRVLPVRDAAGMYLERPALHYTIGTKVKPSVAKTLAEFGVVNVAAHRDPPPFHPVMVRGLENLAHDPDWMVRFLGSYLKKNVLKAVHRGAVSDERGTSYVPSLARASGFGLAGPVKGFAPATPLPPPPKPSESLMQQLTAQPHKAASAPRPRVRAVLPHGEGYLLEQLSNQTYPERLGMTRFPGGGVEPGETAAAALVRELKEELNLAVDPTALRPLGAVRHPVWGHDEHYFLVDGHGLAPGVFPRAGGDGDPEVTLVAGRPGGPKFFGTDPTPLLAAKQATADAFAAFRLEHPAGTRRVLFDDDDEFPDYPLRAVTCHADYGHLPGFRGEDGEPLDAFVGSDPGGLSGSFVVGRPEGFNSETKFYHALTPAEHDRVLREYAPVLRAHTAHATPAELAAALAPFRA